VRRHKKKLIGGAALGAALFIGPLLLAGCALDAERALTSDEMRACHVAQIERQGGFHDC